MTDPAAAPVPPGQPAAEPPAGSSQPPEPPQPVEPQPRRPRRAGSVLALLVGSGLVALTTLPTWVSATAASAQGEPVEVAVRGSVAAPGLVAAALVLLAAAGAVALVGRVGRWVVVGVVAAAGVLVTVSALAARGGATAAAERAAADATGVSGLVGDVVVGPWPVVAAVLGVLVVGSAVQLVRASGRWAAPSDRHERATGPAPAPEGRPAVEDERSTWDALSRGDDPT